MADRTFLQQLSTFRNGGNPPAGRWRFACLTLALLVLPGILAAESGKQGPEPENAGQTKTGQSSAPHWAFQPVERPPVPAVQHLDQVQTPIDAFIVHRLEAAGLSLSPPASRGTLIRRLSYDLRGLPATPEETDRFLADSQPDSTRQLVNDFLASPHYGEAWGRKWLDLVRFAETAGFNADPHRPLAWKYRDYVIRAFNENKPYDRFLAEQLAGDELYPDSEQALVATGYLRMWPDESNASDILLARQDALNDLTGNFGAVVLGLSLGCAQCHDHKFDPISQDDFYCIQSFFSGLVPVDSVPLGTHLELEEYRQKLAAWQASTADVENRLHAIETAARAKAAHIKRLKFPEVVLAAIDTKPAERTALQRQLAFWSERQIELKEQDVLKELTEEEQAERTELQARWKELQQTRPKPPRTAKAMAAVEIPSGPPETFLLAGGSYNVPLYEVEPSFLTAAVAEDQRVARPVSPRPGVSGRRTALAGWLTERTNPLTARVMVNRIWQGHFGRGLVEGGSDFGTRSQPPTHPLLLDWLADEFVRSGWDIQHIHRLIVHSAVYQQASFTIDTGNHAENEQNETASAGTATTADPDNQLYWHFPRRRLTAEQIRDSLLAISGTLCCEMYGPGIRPELPPDFSSREKWTVSEREADRHRRSVYIFAKRNLPYPLLKVFDFPDMHESCARRAETTVAPQSLMLLNSGMVQQYARELALRVLRETPSGSAEARIGRACRLTWGRLPDALETRQIAGYLHQTETLIQQQLAAGEKLDSLPEDASHGATAAEGLALADLCHALMNTNGFLFLE